MKILTAVAAAVACVCLGALSPSSSPFVAADGADHGGGKKWSYKTDDPSVLSPAQWGDQFPACNGKRQSPIDLKVKVGCGTEAPPLAFAGKCPDHKVQQHYDTYKAEVKDGSTCSVSADGEKFTFLQSHFHAPSEHKVNGRIYDAEVHFVHKAGNKLLAIGLFLEKQPKAVTDPFFASFWTKLEALKGEKPVDAKLDPYIPMLEASIGRGRVFNYPGSLTTPGCNETVDWWVIESPVPVATKDFDELVTHLERLEATDHGRGARPAQPLNGRQIVVY